MHETIDGGGCMTARVCSSSSLDGLGNKSTAASKLAERDRSTHGHRWKARKSIMAALSMRCAQRAPGEDQTDTDALERRSYNLHKCNTYPKIWVTASGLPTVVWGQCRDRLCPRCAFYRSKRVSKQTTERLKGCDALRMITLTLAEDQRPLAERLDRLYESFRNLRRREDWKARVRGGVGVVEATLNDETGSWNVHLHLIVDGLYFDQAMLSDMWEDVTGDSRITYIKAVYDRSGCGDYVAKYVNKLSNYGGWPFSRVREFALGMSGRRLVMTWGTLHGKHVDIAPPREHDGMTREIADCNTVASRADDGNPWAKRAILLACALGPKFAGAFGEYAADDWDDDTPPPARLYEEFVDCLTSMKGWRPGRPEPTGWQDDPRIA